MRFLLPCFSASLLALALSGCATYDKDESAARAARELAQALEGRTPGKPVDCVSSTRLNGPQVIDGRTILYRESGRRIWRNDLPDSCPFLRSDSIMIVEMHGSNLCRNDLFSAVDRGSRIPVGRCRLGAFTPYDKPQS